MFHTSHLEAWLQSISVRVANNMAVPTHESAVATAESPAPATANLDADENESERTHGDEPPRSDVKPFKKRGKRAGKQWRKKHPKQAGLKRTRDSSDDEAPARPSKQTCIVRMVKEREEEIKGLETLMKELEEKRDAAQDGLVRMAEERDEKMKNFDAVVKELREERDVAQDELKKANTELIKVKTQLEEYEDEERQGGYEGYDDYNQFAQNGVYDDESDEDGDGLSDA